MTAGPMPPRRAGSSPLILSDSGVQGVNADHPFPTDLGGLYGKPPVAFAGCQEAATRSSDAGLKNLAMW